MGGWDVNVGCGPFRAPEPWVNLDVHQGDGVNPDRVVADHMFPLAEFGDETVGRVYMGHVLEHVHWADLDGFLADILRAMVPGGELCVVGPDAYRTLEQWRIGAEPWELVQAVLESDVPQADLEMWPGATHKWNCHEARVVKALKSAGVVDVHPRPLNPLMLGDWPVVAYTAWQCAATGRKGDG